MEGLIFGILRYTVSRPLQRRQTLDLSMKIDNNNIECLKETVF